METFMTIVAGILLTIGTYLVLSRSLLGVYSVCPFSHGAHLMLLTMAGLKQEAAPLVEQTICIRIRCRKRVILTSIVSLP